MNGAVPQRDADDADAPEQHAFRWPPTPGTPVQGTPEAAQVLAAKPGFAVGSRRSRVRTGLWHDIERTWLGLSVPTVPQRALDAGWTIDPLDLFCWRCGLTIGPFEATANGCSRCPEKRTVWSRYIRLGVYVPPLRSMIHELKFESWRAIGRALGHELGRQIARALDADARAGGPAAVAARAGITLVPVPTTFRRRLLRGVDHSLVIARAAGESLEGAAVRQLLARRHRPSQLAVPQSRRAANVRATMRTRSLRPLDAGLIVVVDDVMTTGATMTAACRPLEAAARSTRSSLGPDGVVIWAATLARSERRGRSSTVTGGSDVVYGISHSPDDADA